MNIKMTKEFNGASDKGNGNSNGADCNFNQSCNEQAKAQANGRRINNFSDSHLSNSTTITTLASNNHSANENLNNDTPTIASNKLDKKNNGQAASEISFIDSNDTETIVAEDDYANCGFNNDANGNASGRNDLGSRFPNSIDNHDDDRLASNNCLKNKLKLLLRPENLRIDNHTFKENGMQQFTMNSPKGNGKTACTKLKLNSAHCCPGNVCSELKGQTGKYIVGKCRDDNLNENYDMGEDKQFDNRLLMEPTSNESNLMVSLKLLAIFSTIYFFMWSSSILSQAFNLTSYHYAGHFIKTSGFLQNPLIGLMVGVITTVIFQSSGAVTSVLVTIVGSGVLDVRQSIPIIMGANLGTSVTNTVVSLIVYRKKENFEIAMTAGIVHDMYNMMSVVFMLPIELLLHPLEYSSMWMLNLFNDSETTGIQANSTHHSSSASSIINDKLQFLSHLVKPLVDLVIIIDKDRMKNLDPNYIVPSNVTLVKKCCNSMRSGNETICYEKCFSLFSHLDFSDNTICLLLIFIAMITLFTCLIFVVRVTKSLLGGKLLNWVARLAKREYNYPYKLFVGYLFILVGLIITVILHSSGVFTSMLVPLAGGDVLSLMQIYELTLGSNVGTTATGIIAALSAQSKYPLETLQVALCHFIFNLAGILMFYTFPYTKLPIWASKRFGMLSAKNMWFSIGYLVIVFFIAPSVTMLIYFATNQH